MKRDKDGLTWPGRNGDWWMPTLMLLFFFTPFGGEGFFQFAFMLFSISMVLWLYGFASKRPNHTRMGLMLGCLTLPLFFAGLYRIFQGTQCLVGELTNPPMDYLYFSYTTYTTLGYGEINPVGWCQLISSVEAMTGLLFTAYVAAVIFRKFQQVEKT